MPPMTCFLGLRGAIDMGALGAGFLEMTLGFEDLHHGHDGGVRDLAAFEHFLVDVAHRRFFEDPDDLHDLQFLFGQGGFRRLILIN